MAAAAFRKVRVRQQPQFAGNPTPPSRSPGLWRPEGSGERWRARGRRKASPHFLLYSAQCTVHPRTVVEMPSAPRPSRDATGRWPLADATAHRGTRLTSSAQPRSPGRHLESQSHRRTSGFAIVLPNDAGPVETPWMARRSMTTRRWRVRRPSSPPAMPLASELCR